jgi:5'-phosphate synthase pdxT subunit
MVDAAPVGVLAFQGDFQKHLELLAAMGRHAQPVRTPEHIDEISALVIPGGESTTIGMLMDRFGLIEKVAERAAAGLPVLGTCAGAILLATDIEKSDQPRIGIMDMTVRRNAYGRQIESFEADIDLATGGDESRSAPRALRAVFIRAPIITAVGPHVEVLARFEGRPVVVRQGNLVAATFHPELSGETAVHSLLLADSTVS